MWVTAYTCKYFNKIKNMLKILKRKLNIVHETIKYILNVLNITTNSMQAFLYMNK